MFQVQSEPAFTISFIIYKTLEKKHIELNLRMFRAEPNTCQHAMSVWSGVH